METETIATSSRPTRTFNAATSSSPTTSQSKAIRKFSCEFSGCGKSFTRAEHLQRHELNHRESQNDCPRCQAHFARPDLLERHMDRHAQKDREAGGEGLGVLVTRKRSWRDEQGNVTTRRPASSIAAAKEAIEARKRICSSPGEKNGGREASVHMPISPSDSAGSGQGVGNGSFATFATQDQHMGVGLSGDEMNKVLLQQEQRTQQRQQGQQEYPELSPSMLTNIDPTPLTDEFIQATFDDLTWDTAASFNMPYTTSRHFSWIFGSIQHNATAPVDQTMGMGVSQESGPGMATLVDRFNIQNHSPVMHPPAISEVFPFDPSQAEQQCLYYLHDHSLGSAEGNVYCGDPDLLSPILGNLKQGAQNIDFSQNTDEHSKGQRYAQTSTQSEISAGETRDVHSHDTPPTSISHSHISPASSNTYQFLQQEPYVSQSQAPASAKTRPVTFLPQIDEVARTQVIELVVKATPNINPDDALLSLSALQNYCDLFFSRFNPAYPLLHRPSFDPSQVNTLLLVSVLMLGATYAENDAHELAVRIHNVLRGVLVSSDHFGATPELWVLQTILLIEVFGKSRAGIPEHDMAHLFHGLLINLIRRSDCQKSTPPNHFAQGSGDLDKDWKIWVLAEEKKRLALLSFHWDVQHAVLFTQSLCMSAFELLCPLPSDSSTWEANSAEEWDKCRKEERPPPLFLRATKSFLSGEAPPPLMNSFSRSLVLHGLMSIMWDMKRRDQTSLGLQPDPDKIPWQLRISKAYDNWKADFQKYTDTTLSSPLYRSNHVLRKDFIRFHTSTLALYHAAHIILRTEILDLQIFAGAHKILGKPVRKDDFIHSRKEIKKWAKSPKAAEAVWHAAKMIKEGMDKLEDWNAGERFSYPWCLYLATLTCWAFNFTARASRTGGPAGGGDPASLISRNIDGNNNEENGEDEEVDFIVWEPWKEMKAFVENICSSDVEGINTALLGQRGRAWRTEGLVAVVSKHLDTVRWALVSEGMVVLKGLIAGRLIKGFYSS